MLKRIERMFCGVSASANGEDLRILARGAGCGLSMCRKKGTEHQFSQRRPCRWQEEWEVSGCYQFTANCKRLPAARISRRIEAKVSEQFIIPDNLISREWRWLAAGTERILPSLRPSVWSGKRFSAFIQTTEGGAMLKINGCEKIKQAVLHDSISRWEPFSVLHLDRETTRKIQIHATPLGYQCSQHPA